MKFKSNLKSEAPVDFSALEQDINTLLNVDLCEAAENLDDLVLLHANIEKYGITEPVMDLIGGTLESWNISIQNKEACLEGLGEKLKEGSKKVWEFIKQLVDKIITFIKGIINKHDPKKAEENATEAGKKPAQFGVGVKCTGIPTKTVLTDLIGVCDDLDKDANVNPKIIADTYKLIFTLNDAGSLDIAEELQKSLSSEDERDFKGKGYSKASEVIKMAGSDVLKALKQAEGVCEFLKKDIANQEKAANDPETNQRFIAKKRIALTAMGKVIPILNRVFTAQDRYYKACVAAEGKAE